MDTMMRDLARMQFMLKGIESECAVFANENGRILYLSPGAEKLWGWKTSQVVGRPLTILMPNRFHRDHERGIQRVVKGGMKSLETSKVLFRTIPLPILTKAGREVAMLVSVAAWRSADSRLYFVASFEQAKELAGANKEESGSTSSSGTSERSRGKSDRGGNKGDNRSRRR
jgi:PAS domain S-box-containing protein